MPRWWHEEFVGKGSYRKGAVYAGPPLTEEYVSTNPKYRFRIDNPDGMPSNYWVTKEDGEIGSTNDPQKAYISQSEDAQCMCCIGWYQVIPELVEE